MLRICDQTILRLRDRHWSRLTPLAAAFTGAVLLFSPSVRAATIDWAVNPGPANYDSALDPDAGATPNWIDTTQAVPAAPPAIPPSNAPVGIPAAGDDAFVRNGGIAEITSAITNLSFTVGASRTLYTDDGVNIIQTEVGGTGTVNMTGGSLAGSGANGLALRIGNGFTGTFNQSGGTIAMSVGGNPGSILTIGSSGNSSTPTSSYNMTGGSITQVYDVNNHLGINVRNGTFDMSGGSVTTVEASGVGNYDQRFMTIASTSGGSNAQHAVASATFRGNAVVDVHHGIRVAPNNRAEGFLTVAGNASIKLGNDLQLAANAGTAGSVDAAYGQMDMSGGYVQVGQYTPSAGTFDKKFIIGDAGRGVFTMTGGSVLVGDQLRMSNNAVSSALMTMKDPVGGPTGVPFTFTTRNFNMRQTSTTDTLLNSDIVIDSDDARFIQKNMFNPQTFLTSTGFAILGGQGKSTFEIKRGQVFLGQPDVAGVDFPGNVDLSNTANSRLTLKLSGGKLTLGSSMTRTNTTAATIPVISLTGGQLVLEPQSASPAAMSWQADLKLDGTELLTRLNQQLVVTVGSATLPGNFTMNSGIWNIDILGHSLNNADRIIVGNSTGTAAMNGGTLNLNYISGYTPAVNDSLRIVGLTAGTPTLNSGAVSIVAPPSALGVWTTQVVGADIRLVFIPEPTSCALTIMGMMVGMVGFRRRS